MESQGEKAEYFFNTQTGKVEQGRQSSWEHLMGPFDTPADAAKALDSAAQRSDAWDDADRAWRGDD